MDSVSPRKSLWHVDRSMNAFSILMALLLLVVMLPMLPIIAIIWFVGWLRAGEHSEDELADAELQRPTDSLA